MSRRETFVREQTRVATLPFLPEIRLHLAAEVTPLWQATEAWLEAHGVPPPFWAFAWSGGQALARYILDSPVIARGMRVLDFASGGGVVAIAAAKAGAEVVAADIDPFAITAVRLNAALNQVRVETTSANLVRANLVRPFDLITAGDICYERAPAAEITAWLRDLSRTTRVLLGDPGRAYLPPSLHEIARYEVPTPLDLEGATTRTTRVFDLSPSTTEARG